MTRSGSSAPASRFTKTIYISPLPVPTMMQFSGGCEVPASCRSSIHRSGLFQATWLQFTQALQHRIGGGTNVRVNTLEITQDIEVQRTRFDALRSAFPQPREVAFCRRILRSPQLSLLVNEFSCDGDVL